MNKYVSIRSQKCTLPLSFIQAQRELFVHARVWCDQEMCIRAQRIAPQYILYILYNSKYIKTNSRGVVKLFLHVPLYS